jgi:hypothetical protein
MNISRGKNLEQDVNKETLTAPCILGTIRSIFFFKISSVRGLKVSCFVVTMLAHNE